jgi:Mn2+/Fe2+ NRAMP family transporter
MSPTFYYILHVGATIVLAGYIFYAFAAPPETRKRVMMLTGIASLLAAVGGFGLQAKLGYGFPVWMIVKIVCWLGLSALAGMAYRRRDKVGVLMGVAVVLVVVALVMVYHTRLTG